MTREELITNCTLRLGTLERPVVNAAVYSILELMTQKLVDNERIEIRGFGSFEVRVHAAKTGRNPKSGEPVYVESKKVPHFKPGKELRERVDK